MTELTLEALRAELAPIKAEIAAMRVRTDGLPLLGNAIDQIQRDVRLLRAAINDMGRTNITAGEVEAMHDDIDRVQKEQMEIGRRLATIERRLDEQR